MQIKIIYRILGTKEYLQKKITDSPVCTLCKQNPQPLTHIFFDCTVTTELLHNLKNWIQNKVNINIQLTKTDLILGYLMNLNYNIPLNTILLVTKSYILWCSRHDKYLNITQLQSWIESTYTQQENISKLNQKHESFSKNWITWKNLFLYYQLIYGHNY